MVYRRFGRTGLQMPVFSCGGMRFQYKWQDMPLAEIPADNRANLEATIRRSLELGINHIETARGYGSSERQLGQILPKLPRDKMIVQTKVSPTKDPAEFEKHVEDSLSRLGLPWVDLLSIHGINNREMLEWSLGPNGAGNGCLAAARRLQKRGLARHIGFSTHGAPQEILEAIRHERDGGFDYVNLHWYWIYQRNWSAIEEATRRDMGVFIISPADKGGRLFDPPGKLVNLCQPWHPLVFNSIFCLNRPEVHTLSIGAARPGDFDLALQALPWLTGERQPEMKATLETVLGRLQDARTAAIPPQLRDPFATFPDWEACPGQMNLPIMLWLWSLAKAFDLYSYGVMRYNLLGNGGHWFPGLNAADADKADLTAVARAAGLDPQELKSLLREIHTVLAKEKVKRLSQT